MKKLVGLLFALFVVMSLVFSVNAEIITDTTGPTVTGAACDKQGETLKPGDTVKFSFAASDPSGLDSDIYVNFYEATSYQGRQFDWKYNSSTGKFEATFTVPEDAQDGEYYISTIYVCDVYENQTTYRTQLGFDVVGGNSDAKGPTVTGAACDKQGETLKPGDTVKFSFAASDPNGLDSDIYVNFYEATSYKGRQFDWKYNSSTGKLEATFTVPEDAQNGEYYISTIYVCDTYGNQTTYRTNLGFNVVGGISDTKGPTITGATCDKQGKTLRPGDTVKFSFAASDPSGLDSDIYVNFYEATSYKGRQFDWKYNSSTGKFEATFTVPDNVKVGEYYISTIYVCDTYGNQTTYRTNLGFNVANGKLGATSKITTAQNTSAIKLTWDKVDTATVYRVYKKNGSSWTKLADVNGNTYTISKLTAGTKYSFAVKAGRLSNGKIEWASGYTTIDTATKTVTPSVSATQNTSAIKLSWKACPGATGYRIYYMSDGVWKVSVSSTTATSHTYYRLNAGAKYTFAIRPYIINGSNVIWSTHTEFTTATKPANVTAKTSSPSAGKITLTWNAVNGADGYQVYYKINNGAYTLYNIYTNVQKLTFSNLNPNTTYTFAVRAGIRTSGGNIYGGYVTSSIKPKSNALTNAKATQLWLEAYDVYYNWASWGLYDNYVDKSRPVYFDGAGTLPYYPIVDHSFDSKADLRAYLYNYFDGVITEEILSGIIEYKGVMYIRLPTGRGIEPEMQSIVVKKQASTYAEVYITFVRSSGEQETFVQKMSLVSGKWIFAEKFYNRPKYDY